MVVNDWIHVIAGFFILAGIILGTWLPPLVFCYGICGTEPFAIRFNKILPRGHCVEAARGQRVKDMERNQIYKGRGKLIRLILEYWGNLFHSSSRRHPKAAPS